MRLAAIVFWAVLALQPASAQDSRPTEQSIKELLNVMHSSKLIDSAMAQVDSVMQNSMQQALAGEHLTADQQKILQHMRAKTAALLKDMLKWGTLEPTMIEVYRKSFTQHELDGMLAFYRSEAGQAVIAKLPTVMQQTMQAMQVRINELMPKLQQLQQDTVAQLRAAAPTQQQDGVTLRTPSGSDPPRK